MGIRNPIEFLALMPQKKTLKFKLQNSKANIKSEYKLPICNKEAIDTKNKPFHKYKNDFKIIRWAYRLRHHGGAISHPVPTVGL